MTVDEAYLILEVDPGCTLTEAKASRRQLIKVWHPDRFEDDATLRRRAETKTKEINRAFDVVEQDIAEAAAEYARQAEEEAEQREAERREAATAEAARKQAEADARAKAQEERDRSTGNREHKRRYSQTKQAKKWQPIEDYEVPENASPEFKAAYERAVKSSQWHEPKLRETFTNESGHATPIKTDTPWWVWWIVWIIIMSGAKAFWRQSSAPRPTSDPPPIEQAK